MWLANSKAVIFHIQGGLVNQLFQYAAALGVSTRLNLPLILDARGYDTDSNRLFSLDAFNISGRVVRRSSASGRSLTALSNELGLWLYKIRNGLIVENSNDYDDRISSAKSSAYFSGYWQNEKYFANVKDHLRRQLVVDTKPNVENSRILQLVKRKPSVAVHIRRGDYLLSPENRNIFVQLNADYYLRAAKYIEENSRSNLNYFVFSDDVAWAAENIKLPGTTIAVTVNDERSAIEDLRLMAACDHNIIANSSFSWWGAWLNPKPDKIVVAPRKWYGEECMSNEHINSATFAVIDN